MFSPNRQRPPMLEFNVHTPKCGGTFLETRREMSSSPQLPEDWIGPTENDGWDARQDVGVCAFSKNVNCFLQDAVRSLSRCAVEDCDYPGVGLNSQFAHFLLE
ncbi:conserved hypothetical protein [Histoplasma capsulatum var. duboisii H88]|uniref:Uncharacterized protein n=2 Tax=Ajellomyces capsulatus TaxID=5037 RepID=C0NK70_AJECG|nr:uncharacterized protein HCBG_03550 [Histoplasma capsulatum G186AR]EEH08260.1 predicted protein [Histoplasma capsulatum G186AR]EGC43291.1 conserved hypothetical protein [Histoplasma capsulatum var. duboisii H88]